MKIVGELINASRATVRQAIEARDEQTIKTIALNQANAGVDFIDVNAGVFRQSEPEHLAWLVQTVQTAVNKPCCIDSPDPSAIEEALKVHRGEAMINSISLETDRYENLLPMIAGTDLKVIALCMSNDGMPETADERVAVAEKLINGLTKNNVSLSNIYIDPLVQSVATNPSFGVEFLGAVRRIMTEFQGVHTMCGLSNISFGLPKRKVLNETFICLAIANGLDGAIINPLDKNMMAKIKVTEALIGRDPFCMEFINAYREGFFD